MRRALVLGWLASACGGAADAPSTNVLLISLDSTRRDLLGAYGRDPVHAPGTSPSPNLDRLASQGVLFEDAYSTTSWTLPAHASLLAGVPEVVHSVDLDVQGLDPDLSYLPAILGEHGYRTAGFYSGPYLEPRFGFGRGFDRYEACYGGELVAASAEFGRARAAFEEALRSGDPSAQAAAEGRMNAAEEALQRGSHRDRSSRSVTDAVLDELAQAARERGPFFVFAHYFDPHFDYLPPPPYDRRFDPHYDGTITGEGFIENPAVYDWESGTRRVSERDLEHIQALYEGELAWTDAEVGRILSALDSLELAHDTLVVVVADHGDEFFEHGSIGHRKTLWEEVVRVPLIARLPGVLPEGERIDGLVSITDVPASVLEAVGLEHLAPPRSRSFFSLARGAEDEGRDVFGRLVTSEPAVLGFRTASGPGRLPVMRVRVTETYRRGSIKVLRERAWTEHPPVSGELARELEGQRAEQLAREELSWIDLERHPDEPADAWSRSFEDPAARDALRAFRAGYETLLELRARASAVESDPAAASALEGLGYGGGGDTSPLASDRLALPPPGEGVL